MSLTGLLIARKSAVGNDGSLGHRFGNRKVEKDTGCEGLLTCEERDFRLDGLSVSAIVDGSQLLGFILKNSLPEVHGVTNGPLRQSAGAHGLCSARAVPGSARLVVMYQLSAPVASLDPWSHQAHSGRTPSSGTHRLRFISKSSGIAC